MLLTISFLEWGNWLILLKIIHLGLRFFLSFCTSMVFICFKNKRGIVIHLPEVFISQKIYKKLFTKVYKKLFYVF